MKEISYFTRQSVKKNKNCKIIQLSQTLTNFNFQGPAALLSYSSDIRHRVGQVRGERPVDVGLQLLEEERNKA